MQRKLSIFLLAACAALAVCLWLFASHSTAPLSAERTHLSDTPAPEALAALDAADSRSQASVEPAAAAPREALEVRTFQTRAGRITVQPPSIEGENRGTIFVWCYLEFSHASVEPAEIALAGVDGRECVHKPGKEQDTFRELAPGAYTVVVRDPRFEIVRVDGVQPGSHVLIDLLGTARVRAHAFDAETGEAIDANSLRLLDYGSDKEFAPDAEGWFTGLPAGDLEERVRAPGCEETKLVAAGLAFGESREVELRFSRAGEIHGVVVADGASVSNVTVALQSNATPVRIFEDVVRFQSKSVRTDGRGRFEFKDLPCGEYRLLARRPGLFEATEQTLVLSADERVKNVLLRIPASCSLSGTLTCSTEAAGSFHPQDLRIVLQPATRLEEWPGEFTQVKEVQADGHFRFDDSLPIERMRVLLFANSPGSARDGFSDSARARTLGELELHAGLNECSFDVSEFLPGVATLQIVSSGYEIDGGFVQVAASDGNSRVATFEFKGSTAILGPLPPGEYRAIAFGREGDWLCGEPVPFQIERGSAKQVRLDPKLVSGHFTLRDSNGGLLQERSQLLLQRTIQGWPGGGVTIPAMAGEDGRIELALQPGEFELSCFTSRESATLRWTDSGPAQAELHLAAK